MSAQPVVLIAAGGTGGHVFPALAVAAELMARGYQIQWLGAPNGIENRLVPANNIPLHLISVSGLRGRGFASWLVAPMMLLKAMFEAVLIVNKIRPNLVLGMGGFASGPGCLMARLCGVPVVIHEQNAIPGMTNTLLARIANRVLEGFDQAFAKKKINQAFYTGNPVRPEIADAANSRGSHHKPQLLLMGGSLGALALNEILPKALSQIPPASRPEVWHQCGSGRSEAVTAQYQPLGLTVKVSDFIDDMAAAYAWADIVICRAGAITVAELAAAGTPAILVPFPAAVDDHQTHNALWLSDRGAAVLLPQQQLTPRSLAKALQRLISTPNLLAEMAEAARNAATPNATTAVATVCQEVAHG